VSSLLDPAPQARLHSWPLDQGVTLLRTTGTAAALDWFVPEPVTSGGRGRITLALLGSGDWRWHQRDIVVSPGGRPATLVLIDHAAPFELRGLERSSVIATSIDRTVLDLPTTTIAAAARRLDGAHPLSALFADFLRGLVDVAERSPDLLPELAGATGHLIRALILARARGDAPVRESLFDRMCRHIEEHIADPNLDADNIAVATNISVRYLYKVWSGSGTTLANYIIARRLELARAALTDPRMRHLTIGAVARRYGFADATHFTRRFRSAYGRTPSQYRTESTLTRSGQNRAH
jgi:AraC-like DNA-binding protein